LKTIIKSLKISLVVFSQGMLAQILSAIASFLVRDSSPYAQEAVAVSNKVFFLLSLLIIGISNGACVLIAHYWGKEDTAGVRKTLGITLILSVLIAGIFSVFSIGYSRELISLFMHTDSDVMLASRYLAILSISFVLYGVCQTYALFYRAVGKGPTMLRITGIITLFNIGMDLLLLKGFGPIPSVGILGIAWAVLVTRILEVVLILIDDYRKEGPAHASLKELVAYDKGFLKNYGKNVWNIFLNSAVVMIANFIFSTAYANISQIMVITMSLFHPLEQIVFALVEGCSASASIVMGHTMGAMQMDRAKRYARNYLRVNFLIGIVLAGVIFLLASPASHLFTTTEAIASDMKDCFYVLCFFVPVKLLNATISDGILKTGGDSAFNALNNFLGFIFCLPFCLLGMAVGLPAHWIYLLFMMGEVLKLGFNITRYFSGKWLQTLVE